MPAARSVRAVRLERTTGCVWLLLLQVDDAQPPDISGSIVASLVARLRQDPRLVEWSTKTNKNAIPVPDTSKPLGCS